MTEYFKDGALADSRLQDARYTNGELLLQIDILRNRIGYLEADAARWRWIAEYPRLYVVNDLLKADQYVTAERAVDALMKCDKPNCGPWRARQDPENKQWGLYSGGLVHDARLYLSGNFPSAADEARYAEKLAAYLNGGLGA